MSFNSRDATLQFIQDYKSYEGLWNSLSKAYTNKRLRFEALQALSTKYNMSIDAVKNKIKSLRSYFCREHHKVLSTDPQTEPYVSSWFAYQHLLFIADSQPEFVDIKEEYVQDDSFQESISSETQILPELSCSTTEESSRKRKSPTMSEEDTKTSTRRDEDHEYTVFGELIGHKVRNLRTKRLRATAENKIMNLLFDLEVSPENLSE